MTKKHLGQLPEQLLVGRVGWLITLRWLAILALASTVLLVDKIFPVRFPVYAKHFMLGIVVLIFVYNLFLFTRLRRIRFLVRTRSSQIPTTARTLIHFQIVADLVCLGLILNFSGGLINPFCIFLIFHVAIAGIILPRLEAFWVALLSSMLLVVLGFLGAIFPGLRVPLENFPLERVLPPLTENWFYIFSVCLTFSGTFFLIAFLTTGVSARLQEVLDDLEQANESIRHQDELLSRFLRTATHQLRSPLAAIVSLINAYLTTQTKEMDQSARDLLVRIEHRSHSLMELIDDLLRLTQIREGLDSPAQGCLFDLNKLVADYCQPFITQARGKNLEFQIRLDAEPAKILAQEQDISDMVENLVSNAIKYTETGTITVEGRRDDANYVLTVRDTGMGIPEKDQDRLFEEFFRAGNAHKKYPHSSGLGLHITRAIVTRLNGKIEFASQLEKGTTFTITLPLAM